MSVLEAGYRLVLYDGLSSVALAPLVTYAILAGAVYGLLRLLIDPVVWLIRWEDRHDARKAARRASEARGEGV